ncbi:prolyl 4-hydroxylase subunit alpha-1-like isoform X2 [Lycorma delicatula]|uniref:prolyl 4-hydroxylase subunit alpha-1-like isoform X2 n=1 Tax=Lycorma delicatula TaxID=130591 RepID=UPI003F51777C
MLTFKLRKISFSICLLIFIFDDENAEIFSSTSDMEKLIKTENSLLKELDTFIAQIESNLQILKKRAYGYAKEHKTRRDINNYIHNPINAFKIIKLLTVDWKRIVSIINNINEELKNNLIYYKSKYQFPTDEDLNGAAAALLRLQVVYKLKTSSIAKGELDGVQYETQLFMEDCFELGIQAYHQNHFYHAMEWMNEALNKYDAEENDTFIKKWEIFDSLANILYQEGDLKSALDITNEILHLVPNHKATLHKQSVYEKEIRSSTTCLDSESCKKKWIPDIYNYEMLCRKELFLSSVISSKMKCQYVHRNIPFLRLAPLKEEEAYLEPRILLYRDVMSDNEIKTIQKLAEPRLQRAKVQDAKNGSITSNYRTSKSAWLSDYEDDVIATISQRVEDMTSLTTATAEDLQVGNYGIGGHYSVHVDYLKPEVKEKFNARGTGDRIATVLFYMSNVNQGGATVFPSLNMSVWPEKGTALFWYNLHSNGETDSRTLHAACPVLAGSKWVCNKWLHEVGQEFRRPCYPDN